MRAAPGHRHGRPASAPRPPERAQLVWRRALELADPAAQEDRFSLALDLLRAAHQDSATMAHALNLGRTRVRLHPHDAVALSGVTILEAAILLLGVKPRSDDVASTPS
jgi:hypothetical protein